MQTSSSLQLFDATWIYFLGSRIADNYTRVILRECESAKTMRAAHFLYEMLNNKSCLRVATCVYPDGELSCKCHYTSGLSS